MSLNEFLNDKKYTAAFFLLALCFFLLDWYLFAAVGEKEEHIRRLETETALLENRAKLPKRSSRMPFLETLLEDTTADTVCQQVFKTFLGFFAFCSVITL